MKFSKRLSESNSFSFARSSRALSVVLLATSGVIGQTVPTSWTTFQGNISHDGYVPTLLYPNSFTQRWQRTFVTTINPITAADGKIFVSESGYHVSGLRLRALTALGGGEIWSQAFGNVSAVNPPAYADGKVYIQIGRSSSSIDPYIASYNATNGTQIFKTNYSGQWNGYRAPTPYKGNVYGGFDSGIYSYTGTSGTLNWSNPGPLLFENWTPAVDGIYAYAFTNNGNTGPIKGKLTIANMKTGATAATVLDDIPLGGNPISSIALGSQQNAVTIAAGRLVNWSTQIDATHTPHIAWAVTSNFGGQPSIANGVIYAYNGGVLTAINEQTGNTLWTWGSGLAGQMIVTKNNVLVSNGSQTFAVDLQSHQSVWNFPKGGNLTLSENTLFISDSLDNSITAINAAFGPPHFVWNKSNGDSWATASNWTQPGPAAGMDYIANFNKQTLASDATVTLDGNQTIGGLFFGDIGNAHNWILETGTGGNLQLLVTSDVPEINVANQTTTINASLAGNQGFNKLGNGKLVLSGNNTYTGVTILNEGTLSINADNNLSSDALSIKGGVFEVSGTFNSARNININDQNCMIQVDGSNVYTATSAATIGGGGGLTKSGPGTLQLSVAATTWSGTTMVSQGVLTVNDLTSSSDVIVSGGTLNVNTLKSTIPLTVGAGATANITSSNSSYGAIINNGSINFTSNTGTITLTSLNGAGNTSFSAGANFPTLSAGTITVAGAAVISGLTGGTAYFNGASAAINTLGNASVNLSTGTVLTVKTGTQGAGGISGLGSLIKTGNSTVSLGVANTYTGGTLISGGTLQIGNGGTTGYFVGDVTNNATLLFKRSNTYEFANVISGTGKVTQAGSGTTILSGANTYTGSTSVTAGTLEISGSIAGATAGDLSISYGSKLNVTSTGSIVFGPIVNAGTFATANGGVIAGIKDGQSPGGGTTTIVSAGILESSQGINQTNVTLTGGSLIRMGTNGSSTGVSRINNLNIASDGIGGYVGMIDLKDNDLIIDYTGGSSSYASILARVKAGLAQLGGNGTGIGSSTVDSQTLAGTMLAIVDNGDAAIAGGIKTLSGAAIYNPKFSVLVKYTWFGDANLDGVVNGSDYALLDTGFTNPAMGGWVFGDFNYDGVVDNNDYGLIDTGFIAQTGALPEPSLLGLLGIGLLGLRRRRLH